jgi:hypothetical protein
MIISDQDYYEILTEIGYPVLQQDDLEFTKQQIEDYFIFPALRLFFTWFPKTEIQSTFVASDFSIDFPDENTYGVIDARINTSITSDGRTSSPFINSLYFKQTTSGYNMYGTGNDYGVRDASYLERSFNKTVNNSIRVKRLDVDTVNKKLTGYTTINGELIITWAKFSNNFDDVPFIRKTDVINLAKSNVLKGFAMLRSQLNSDVGVEFNTSEFLSRSQDLEDKVMEKWKAISKVTILRN